MAGPQFFWSLVAGPQFFWSIVAGPQFFWSIVAGPVLLVDSRSVWFVWRKALNQVLLINTVGRKGENGRFDWVSLI